MTAATKERRDELRRMSIMHEERGVYVHDLAMAVPSLLDAADRLAAIEAVTEEGALDLAKRLQAMVIMDEVGSDNPLGRDAADAIISLSANVAEQAEEIERLKRERDDWNSEADSQLYQRQAAERWAEDSEAKCRELEQDHTVDQTEVNYATIRIALAELSGIPAMAVVTMDHVAAIADKLKAAQAKVAELEQECTHTPTIAYLAGAHYCKARAEADKKERDRLRRLLTETADDISTINKTIGVSMPDDESIAAWTMRSNQDDGSGRRVKPTKAATMPEMTVREAILKCIDRDGGIGTWTCVIANMLGMKSYFDNPFKLTTDQVRRELERMERDGIVERKPTQSRLYIAWGRKNA